MKANFILLIFVATCLIGCVQDTDEQPILINNNSNVENSKQQSLNPESDHCLEVVLFAGQFYEAGNVVLDVENGFLTVTYETQGDWEIDATHLYVGACDAIPMNKKGNPKIGHFPYSGTHQNGTTKVVYSIDLNDLPDCVCIAAHAEVSIDGPGLPYQSETAWGNGISFPGNNWAMFFEYCLDQCVQNQY